MEFDSVISKRKSVRAFKPKKPSWKDIIEIVEAALKAPSASSQSHLKFIIIESTETIKELARLAEQIWIGESRYIILVCSNDASLESLYGNRGRVYSRQQAGAAIENLLLKVTDLGLAACWVGAYSDDTVRHLLRIPSNIQIEAMIPIGYEFPGRTKSKRKKQSLESSIFWESWDSTKRSKLFREPPIMAKR